MGKFKVGDKVVVNYSSIRGEVIETNYNDPIYDFPVKVEKEYGEVGRYTDHELTHLEQPTTPEEHTGGSSSYYDVEVGGSTVRCLDIIEALDMSYNEGNIFKAVWRIAAAKKGKKKKGNNMFYDSEKIVFFGERLIEEHKEVGIEG